MLKNYFKIAFRNLVRYKGHSFINIAGIAIGISACLLLFLWVQYELSYDRYHENADRIYRVIYQYEVKGRVNHFAKTPAPLGPALVNEFPEIRKAVRFTNNKFLIRHQGGFFYEYVFFSDPEIFDVFTLPLVMGNSRTALKDPYSILISEEMREKYFPGDNPIGKTITLDEKRTYIITGVFKNIPRNSHFRFNFLGSFLNYHLAHSNQWGISNYYTYLLTSKDFRLDTFREKLPQFVEKYRGKKLWDLYKIMYPLQPLTRIHLYSHLRGEIEPNGDIGNVFIFSAIALFILLIACLNYINLSTARFSSRSKEVALRKIIGATRLQLIKQFLIESYLFASIALPIAMLLMVLLLPLFNSISGRDLVINFFDNLFLLTGLVGIILFVGFISGIFPALIISTLQPVRALKKIFKPGSLLRRSLVVGQFVLSSIFVISTIIISNQLNFMRNKELGFDKENIISIPIYSKEALQKYEIVKNEFLQNTDVLAVSASNFFPGINIWNVNYWRKGMENSDYSMISCINADQDFLKTFGIKLVNGRGFSKDFPGDVEDAYIINQSACKEFGWESPIGQEFKLGAGKKGTVIGVVKDFHFRSLREEIKPTVLYIDPEYFSYFSVKISHVNISKTIAFLGNKWQELVPGQPFEYSFLDEDIEKLYKVESRLKEIFIIVTFLALFIASLGLFGLVAFTAEQRTKEIGIRKVLGASVPGIALLLSKEFTRWVFASNIIAWPIAWYVMDKWLQNFAYRTSMGIWIFLLAGIIGLAISLLTVSYKSIRAASVNPVDALRFE